MSQGKLRTKKFDEGMGEDPDHHMLMVYTRFLQGLFNFMPEGHFHWEPDREATEIIITTEAPLDQEIGEKFPCLVVMMGPCQWQGLSIDQMVSYDLGANKRVSMDLRSGYFVVYAVAGNDVVARRLGQIVERETRTHRRLLEGKGGFHHIARPAASLNAPSPPGSLVNGNPKGLVMVQVNVPFHYPWAWSDEPGRQSPQFQSLAMVLQEERAVDYPYREPQRLETIQLAISTSPVVVRRISGSASVRPVNVEVTGAVRPFQIADLRPPKGR